MVKRVPSRPTLPMPSASSASAVGCGDVEERHGQRRDDLRRTDMHGVGREPDDPAALRLERSRDAGQHARPAPSQSPARCIGSIGAKSTEWTISGAECKPPSACAVSRLRMA